ncbi:unnamed protein product [Coffea canephora]|uniref:Glycylpeptide N-tetradecanoyltransferase n=1 Tax=Coffea canephora TaxID=49390 RepID=A0A068VLI8_COFCA|nr:unnamed protein product [Coffea canephora]
MADKDSASGANNENPDRNSDENPVSSYKASLENLVQRFQNSNPFDQKHKFWETQPVGQFKDVGNSSLPEGPIELPTPSSEVKQEPYNLPNSYEWSTCDMGSDEVCNEVYVLLTNNYVEDDDNMFRFNYSKEFLRWALRSPGYYSSWHVGVRVKASKKLKLRSKRLAPVMIKEVTRRIHLENVWQAAYTAGVLLPTPLTTSQYWHRTLNPKKLIDVGFSRLGERMTMSRAIKLYKLPTSTSTPGLRKMELRDVPSVTQLLRNYLSRFSVAPEFDDNESQVTHEITDFFSFYTLPSSILHSQEYSILKAAYTFYYVSTNTPLLQLMNDALIIAKQEDFDVFNALDVMENESFLKELKFGQGDGQLYYYLYNYRLNQALKPSGLGLVLL